MNRVPRGVKWAALVVAVVFALVASACTSSDSAGETDAGAGSDSSDGAAAKPLEGEIKIGFTADLSGKFSGNGKGLADGFQAYFDWINENGGVAGKKISYTILDDASDSARGLANITQLTTQDQVVAIGGFLVSNLCGAAEPAATASKIPLMCSSVSGDLLHPAKDFVFTQSPGQDEEALPLSDVVNELSGEESGQKVAIVTFASASSLVLRDELLAIGKMRDWDVVVDAQVPLTATDVSSQGAEIIAAKPDVVITSLADTLQIQLQRQLLAAKVTFPLVNYDGSSYLALSTLQDPLYYLLSAFAYTDESEGFKQYAEIVGEADIDPLQPFVNRGYLQAMILSKALDSCDGCKGDELQKAIANLTFETDGFTAGPVKFTPERHQGLETYSVYNWENGGPNLAFENLPAGTSAAAK